MSVIRLSPPRALLPLESVCRRAGARDVEANRRATTATRPVKGGPPWIGTRVMATGAAASPISRAGVDRVQRGVVSLDELEPIGLERAVVGRAFGDDIGVAAASSTPLLGPLVADGKVCARRHQLSGVQRVHLPISNSIGSSWRVRRTVMTTVVCHVVAVSVDVARRPRDAPSSTHSVVSSVRDRVVASRSIATTPTTRLDEQSGRHIRNDRGALGCGKSVFNLLFTCL